MLTLTAITFLFFLMTFFISGGLSLAMLLSPPEWEESSNEFLRNLDSTLERHAPWFMVVMIGSMVFITLLGFPLALSVLL